MCTVLLPPGVNPIAVNKCVIFVYRNVFVNNSLTKYNEVVKSYVLLCSWKSRQTNVQTRSFKIFWWMSKRQNRLNIISSGKIDHSEVELVRNLVAHGDAREGKWRGNWRMEWVASTLTPPPKVVYPTLLKLMCTPRLPAVDWTDAPPPI